MNIPTKDVDVSSIRADEKRFAFPSNGDMLEAFEQLTFRSVERSNCSSVFDYLYCRGFIEWKSLVYDQARGSMLDVAQMCGSGYAALDWLRSVGRSPQWEELKYLSYGT